MGNAPRSTQQWVALIMKAYTNTEGIQSGVVGHQNQEDQGQTNDKGAFVMTLMSKSQ